jgi:hypothetical protein
MNRRIWISPNNRVISSYKGKNYRSVEGKYHSREEDKMSLRIAKTNVRLNPDNKYYLDILKKEENKWI